MGDGEMVRAVWRSWIERGDRFTSADWSTPTRLPGWTVKDLYAHVAPDATRIDALTGMIVEGPAVAACGSDLLRLLNVPGGIAESAAPAVEQGARETGSSLGTAALLDRFRDMLDPERAARAERYDPDATLPYPGLGAVTFRALTDIMLVEATVHLLDVVAAVGGPPPPAEAVARARDIVLGAADPIALLEAATGRTSDSPLPVMR